MNFITCVLDEIAGYDEVDLWDVQQGLVGLEASSRIICDVARALGRGAFELRHHHRLPGVCLLILGSRRPNWAIGPSPRRRDNLEDHAGG